MIDYANREEIYINWLVQPYLELSPIWRSAPQSKANKSFKNN